MDDPSSYNDSNRAFIQAFLARGTLTYSTGKPILASIFTKHEGREVLPNDITEADFRSYVSAANLALSPLDLEIRSTFHQRSREERIYGLVNTSSDALTQMATTYSVEEMGFVKRLLDWMFEGPGNTRRLEAMCITGTDAVNLAKGSIGRRETQNGNTQGGGSQGLSMREAEGMMGRLVEEGWIEKSGKGFYSLSPRALMELRGWLVETYNDPDEEVDGDGRVDRIKSCQACKEIVTVGERCPKRECPCRLHEICTANFFRIQRNRNCPICKAEWDGKHFVGEKAITTSDKYLQGKRRSGARRVQQEAEQEADEDEEI